MRDQLNWRLRLPSLLPQRPALKRQFTASFRVSFRSTIRCLELLRDIRIERQGDPHNHIIPQIVVQYNKPP